LRISCNDRVGSYQVGDYGAIDKGSGQFEKEGNIYENESMAALAAKHPPQTASKDEIFEISSDHVKRIELVWSL